MNRSQMSHSSSRITTRRFVTALGLLLMLALGQLVVGCAEQKTTETTKKAAPKKVAQSYGADPTPLNPERPIRGRIVTLEDARKLSLIPIAEPRSMKSQLRQVRIDTGTVENPTTRVHLIYSKSAMPAPAHKAKLWDGTPVSYDGGISFKDISRLDDGALILFELTPKKPQQMTGRKIDINGISASYFEAKDSLSRLEWWSQGISYHVFAKQPESELRKIAESIPRPLTMLPVQRGEMPLVGTKMELKEARKHPLFSSLNPDEPRLTPEKSSLRSLIGTYSPEEKIATLYLIYSKKKLPVVATKVKMSDGSSVSVNSGLTLQSTKEIPGGMMVIFQTEAVAPAVAPGLPAVVNRKKAYFKESYKPSELARPLPSEIRWHEKGAAIRVFAYLHRTLLVQVGSSFPKVRDEL